MNTHYKILIVLVFGEERAAAHPFIGEYFVLEQSLFVVNFGDLLSLIQIKFCRLAGSIVDLIARIAAEGDLDCFGKL